MLTLFMLWLIAAVLLFGGGWAVKLFLDKTNNAHKFDAHEFAIVSPIQALVILPAIGLLGWFLSVQHNYTYHENKGGWETATRVETIACSEDGPCTNTYSCDTHTVIDHEAYTDENGHDHPQESHQQSESCPYTTVEYTFVVDTTVGPQVLGAHWLPSNPNANRWQEREEHTGYYEWTLHDVPSALPRGIPVLWDEAKSRIGSGNPGPVTVQGDYANYILASQMTILKKYQGVVAKFEKNGLLPPINHAMRTPYYLDRVSFVKIQMPRSADWQLGLERFNAALGNELQGDLYVVVVKSDPSLDPDDYTGALNAYWQSKTFGKDALSKNGIIVVLGTTNGVTIDWARAATGMPTGNYAMSAEIQQRLPGTALNPTALFGTPRATIADRSRVTVTNSPSALGDIILTGSNKFSRVHMGKDGKGTGYLYLKGEIPVSGGELTLIFMVMTLSVFASWAFCIFHGVNAYRNSKVYRQIPVFNRQAGK